MKKLKSLLPFLLMLFALVGCKTDDLEKDIDSLKDRVTNLEAQVSLLNDNMNAIRVILDGTKTISSYTVENGTYILTLSDGTTISLKQGSEGQNVMPDITINQNGEWVLNGNVIGQATGANGMTPKFNISADKYWQISLDGGLSYDYVLDVNGEKVPATTGDSVEVSDAFFTSVEVKNDMLMVTLKDGETYSLPIVTNLIANIVDPVDGFKNGVWTIGYGETVTTEVEISGDNYFVTVPAGGWTATLSDVIDGKATLTVTAPAQSSTLSRATADNSTELVLQVNKGINWALDKIKVEAKAVIASYKALYDAGQTLNIGGVEISKEKFGEATLVDADRTLTEQAESFGVFFVNPGVTLTYNVPNSISPRRMIVIGNNELDNTACFKLAQRFQTNQTSQPEDIDGYFVWQNVIFDASALTQACMVAYTAEQRSIIFDKCEMKLPKGKNLFEATTNGRYLKNFLMQNCKIKIEANSNMINLGNNNSATGFETMKVVNNVFYAETPLTNVKLFNGQNATITSVEVANNTFVNLQSTTSGYFYGTVSSSIICQNNLIYCTGVTANQVVFRLKDNDTANLSGTCSRNVIYKDGTFNWQLFYGGKMPVADGEQAEILTVDPFDGGTFELSTGTFVPNTTYAEYGAKFE